MVEKEEIEIKREKISELIRIKVGELNGLIYEANMVGLRVFIHRPIIGDEDKVILGPISLTKEY